MKFNNLDLIFTDEKLVPPSHRCFNCSGKHAFAKCGQPWRVFCQNCGRRLVNIWDCHRCGKVYPFWLEHQGLKRGPLVVTTKPGTQPSPVPDFQVLSTARQGPEYEGIHGTRKKTPTSSRIAEGHRPELPGTSNVPRVVSAEPIPPTSIAATATVPTPVPVQAIPTQRTSGVPTGSGGSHAGTDRSSKPTLAPEKLHRQQRIGSKWFTRFYSGQIPIPQKFGPGY